MKNQKNGRRIKPYEEQKGMEVFGNHLSVCMMSTLNGCGSDKKEVSQEKENSKNAQFSWDMCSGDTITVLFNEHQYVAPIIDKMEDFEKLTGIKVEHSTIPESNYFDKIGTLLNAKSDKLDIFMTGPYQIWEYGSAGYMEDLQPYIDNDKRLIRILIRMISSSQYWILHAGMEWRVMKWEAVLF